MTELGNIVISPNVIRDIIIETLNDVDGVLGVYNKDTKASITKFFKAEDKNSVEVEMGETECVVDMSISVEYGCKIKDVAKEVQTKVKDKIEELTSVTVKEVNVVVEQVIKKEKVNDAEVENV